MADPFLLGGFNFGLNTVGNLIDSDIRRRGELERRRFEQMMAAQERNWNLQMWNRQNQYNDPSSQMARLKAAGLNPRMIYGAGSAAASGTAGAVQGYDRPKGQNAFENFQGFAGGGDAMMQGFQQAKMKADATLTLAKAKGEEIRNPKLETLIDSQIDNLNQDTQLKEQNTNKAFVEWKQLNAQEQSRIKYWAGQALKAESEGKLAEWEAKVMEQLGAKSRYLAIGLAAVMKGALNSGNWSKLLSIFGSKRAAQILKSRVNK